MNATYTGAMDEIEILRREMSDLKREVATLRRSRYVTPGALVVALIALVSAGLAQSQQEQPGHQPTQMGQDLVCKSVQIVDAAGHEMAKLGSDKDGGLLVINGADSKKRFFTAVENDAGFSDWYDPSGARRASVFVGESGNAEFHLADKLDHVTAVFQQANTGGFLSLLGPDNNNRLAAGVDNGGGYLDLSDAQGNLRGTLYLSDKNTAQFKLLGADKTPRLLFSANPDGGQTIAYGADGKEKATFPGK